MKSLHPRPFALAWLTFAACVHVPNAKERDEAQIHYEIAIRTLVNAPPTALKEVDDALRLNPNFAEAWHLKGLLMQHSFGRLDDAKAFYTKAIVLKSPYPEAEVSLGNAFMDEARYDEAIAHYQRALNDPTYQAPFLARTNLGWAFYKKKDVPSALKQLEAARTLNPKFCLTHLKLGQISEETGSPAEACRSFARYRETCPNRADAYLHSGKCLLAEGKKDDARADFDTCVQKTTDDGLKESCAALRDALP